MDVEIYMIRVHNCNSQSLRCMICSHRIPGNDVEPGLETEREPGREVAGWTTTINQPRAQSGEDPLPLQLSLLLPLETGCRGIRTVG